jgi:hypothetical protein
MESHFIDALYTAGKSGKFLTKNVEFGTVMFSAR